MHYQRVAAHGTTDDPRPTAADRFWANVQKSDDCWLWTGRRNEKRYGIFFWNGRESIATRFAIELVSGRPVAAEMSVLHKCDNPPCVNPVHLWVGTQKENIADMYAKGRNTRPIHRGVLNPRARLTENQVVEIRQRAASGEKQSELAEVFGVNYRTINVIVNGKAWRHLQLENDR